MLVGKEKEKGKEKSSPYFVTYDLVGIFFFPKRGRKRRKGGGIKSLSLPELHTTTTAIRYSVLYERCHSLLLFLFVPRFIAAPWRKMARSYDDEGCYFPSKEFLQSLAISPQMSKSKSRVDGSQLWRDNLAKLSSSLQSAIYDTKWNVRRESGKLGIFFKKQTNGIFQRNIFSEIAHPVLCLLRFFFFCGRLDWRNNDYILILLLRRKIWM